MLGADVVDSNEERLLLLVFNRRRWVGQPSLTSNSTLSSLHVSSVVVLVSHHSA